MNAEQLEYEQKTIDADIKRIAGQLGAEAVYDGVISPGHYLRGTNKTAWVLREPHDSGGDYDYKEDIVNKTKGRVLKGKRYFNPMRYVEYALNNNFALWDKIPDSDDDASVYDSLLNVAFLNINKIVGGAAVDYGNFWDRVDKFSEVVKRQLAVAQPKVIVAAGTIDFFRRYGLLENCRQVASSENGKQYKCYYVCEHYVVLDCYHLAHTTISQAAYCEDIIKALREAEPNGFAL